MPAHLESTDRALKAEQSGISQGRRDRMVDEDQDGQQDHRKVDSESVTAPGVGQDKRWRTRVKAAIVLKKESKKKSKPGEEPKEHLEVETDKEAHGDSG